MICPRCSTEYRTGFDQCADCDIPLVHALPAGEPAPTPSPEPNPEWVTVANLTSQSDVALLKSMLESEGVAFVVAGGWAFALGTGIESIMVPVNDQRRANEIVKQLADGHQTSDE